MKIKVCATKEGMHPIACVCCEFNFGSEDCKAERIENNYTVQLMDSTIFMIRNEGAVKELTKVSESIMSFREAFLFTNNLVVECIGRVNEIREKHPEIVYEMPQWKLHNMPPWLMEMK